MTAEIKIECATIEQILSYIDEIKDVIREKIKAQTPVYSLKMHPEGNWAVEINNNQ